MFYEEMEAYEEVLNQIKKVYCTDPVIGKWMNEKYQMPKGKQYKEEREQMNLVKQMLQMIDSDLEKIRDIKAKMPLPENPEDKKGDGFLKENCNETEIKTLIEGENDVLNKSLGDVNDTVSGKQSADHYVKCNHDEYSELASRLISANNMTQLLVEKLHTLHTYSRARQVYRSGIEAIEKEHKDNCKRIAQGVLNMEKNQEVSNVIRDMKEGEIFSDYKKRLEEEENSAEKTYRELITVKDNNAKGKQVTLFENIKQCNEDLEKLKTAEEKLNRDLEEKTKMIEYVENIRKTIAGMKEENARLVQQQQEKLGELEEEYKCLENKLHITEGKRKENYISTKNAAEEMMAALSTEIVGGSEKNKPFFYADYRAINEKRVAAAGEMDKCKYYMDQIEKYEKTEAKQTVKMFNASQDSQNKLRKAANNNTRLAKMFEAVDYIRAMQPKSGFLTIKGLKKALQQEYDGQMKLTRTYDDQVMEALCVDDPSQEVYEARVSMIAQLKKKYQDAVDIAENDSEYYETKFADVNKAAEKKAEYLKKQITDQKIFIGTEQLNLRAAISTLLQKNNLDTKLENEKMFLEFLDKVKAEKKALEDKQEQCKITKAKFEELKDKAEKALKDNKVIEAENRLKSAQKKIKLAENLKNALESVDKEADNKFNAYKELKTVVKIVPENFREMMLTDSAVKEGAAAEELMKKILGCVKSSYKNANMPGKKDWNKNSEEFRNLVTALISVQGHEEGKDRKEMLTELKECANAYISAKNAQNKRIWFPSDQRLNRIEAAKQIRDFANNALEAYNLDPKEEDLKNIENALKEEKTLLACNVKKEIMNDYIAAIQGKVNGQQERTTVIEKNTKVAAA